MRASAATVTAAAGRLHLAGEHPDWDEYREAMRRQDKSLIRIAIYRWGPIATGGSPARDGYLGLLSESAAQGLDGLSTMLDK